MIRLCPTCRQVIVPGKLQEATYEAMQQLGIDRAPLLTPSELAILTALVEGNGQFVSFDVLYEKLWPPGRQRPAQYSNSTKVLIHRLRKKLELFKIKIYCSYKRGYVIYRRSPTSAVP